jgi:hypothetical protein
MRQNELPQNYQPEPFLVPIPRPPPSEIDEFGRSLLSDTRTNFYTGSSDTSDMTSTSNDLSAASGPFVGGGSSGGGRKGGVPKPMRAVNIIQHQDMGLSNNGEPVDTIELPPAYTTVRTFGGTGSPSGNRQ